MLFDEDKETSLVGGIEEHTPNFIVLNRRAHKFQEHATSTPLWKSTTPGIQMSEGAAFFVLNKEKTEKNTKKIKKYSNT